MKDVSPLNIHTLFDKGIDLRSYHILKIFPIEEKDKGLSYWGAFGDMEKSHFFFFLVGGGIVMEYFPLDCEIKGELNDDGVSNIFEST
jgi:hypothetical protein